MLFPIIVRPCTRRGRRPGASTAKARMRKQFEYGMQLRAKQSPPALTTETCCEGAVRKYFEEASRKPGMAGENLMRMLESRLDNIAYRCGFASSRKEARQLVRHNHFRLNGHKANIPSIQLRAGDVLTIAEGSRSSDKIKAVVEANASRPTPKWLDVDAAKMEARVLNLPDRGDIDFDVAEHLIVELYSK